VSLTARLSVWHTGITPIADMAQRLTAEAKACARGSLTGIGVETVADSRERILALFVVVLILALGLRLHSLARRGTSGLVADPQLGSSPNE